MKRLPFRVLGSVVLAAFLLSVPLVYGESPQSDAAGTGLPLRNISSRAQVGTGETVLIGGFIIRGDVAQNIVVRALGPSLSIAGTPLAGRLGDPVLELHGPSGELISTNDNWRDSQPSAIEATGVAPSHPLESAIRATLPPGNYSVIVRGKGGQTGLGLVEVYDLDNALDRQLANLSTRGAVGSGAKVLIGGLIVGTGSESAVASVVLRAIGPSLRAAGISNPLGDPSLQLFDGNGVLIASNDDWADDNILELQNAGLIPSDPRESALVTSLPAGNYTAIVRGKDESNGIGLVEAFSIQQPSLP